MREAVSRLGDLRPCSYAESVGRDVPERRARSACVRRAFLRADVISSAVAMIGDCIRSDTSPHTPYGAEPPAGLANCSQEAAFVAVDEGRIEFEIADDSGRELILNSRLLYR